MINEVSFFARGVSSTANNPNVNVMNLNQRPVTQLTFVRPPGGDLVIDFAGGQPDPDTRVMIGGQTYTFTANFSGIVPFTATYADVGGNDLRGDIAVVITVHGMPGGGQRFVFFPRSGLTAQQAALIPHGAMSLTPNNTALNFTSPIPLLCFAAGTRIAVPGPCGARTERAIEAIRAGDRVLTFDGGVATVRWTMLRRIPAAAMAADPGLRPVVIAAGAFGPGRPARTLRLSPQHRVLLTGWAIGCLFGADRAFAAALHLAGAPGIAVERAPATLDYHHLMCDRHEVLMADGLPCESFNPGDVALSAAGAAMRAEMAALFGRPPRPGGFLMAARVLRAHEARVAAAWMTAPGRTAAA